MQTIKKTGMLLIVALVLSQMSHQVAFGQKKTTPKPAVAPKPATVKSPATKPTIQPAQSKNTSTGGGATQENHAAAPTSTTPVNHAAAPTGTTPVNHAAAPTTTGAGPVNHAAAPTNGTTPTNHAAAPATGSTATTHPTSTEHGETVKNEHAPDPKNKEITEPPRVKKPTDKDHPVIVKVTVRPPIHPDFHRAEYTRDPHVYGGHRFYAYHDYYYYHYEPFVYGPEWHPLGYVIADIAAEAVAITIANAEYRYYAGVYYQAHNGGGYEVTAAPLGAALSELPAGNVAITVGDGSVKTFYYGGTFYSQTDDGGYQVIAAPAGAVVDNLPDGAKEQNMGGVTYMFYNKAYFQPIQQDGRNAYEVVEVKADQ